MLLSLELAKQLRDVTTWGWLSCNRRFLHLPCSGVVVAHVKPNQPSGKVPLNLPFSDSTRNTAAAQAAYFQIYFIFRDECFRVLLLHKQNSTFNFFLCISCRSQTVKFHPHLSYAVLMKRVICCPLSWQGSIWLGLHSHSPIFPRDLQGHQNVYLMNIYKEISLKRKRRP